LYYPCGTTQEADQLIPYDANLTPGITVKLTNGLCYTIAVAACYQIPGSFTVDGEYSTCEDCEQTYPTPTATGTPASTPTSTPPPPPPSPTPTPVYYYYLVYDVNINCNASNGVVYRNQTDYSSTIGAGQYVYVNGDFGTLKYIETTFAQAFVNTLNSIVVTSCTPPPAPSPTPTSTPPPTTSCTLWNFINSSPDFGNYVDYTDCDNVPQSVYVPELSSPQYCVKNGTTPVPADVYITVEDTGAPCI
jgi:hypothetical protein